MSVFGACSPELTLSGDDNNTITKTSAEEDWANAAYGNMWIDSKSKDLFSWEITFNKIPDDKPGNITMQFGIVSNKHHGKTDEDIDANNSWVCSHRGSVRIDGKVYNETKGHRVIEGDTITLTLDINKGQLLSSKNDDTKVLVQDIKKSDDIKYRFALSMFYPDISLTVKWNTLKIYKQRTNKLQQQLEQCQNKIISLQKSNYNLHSVLNSYMNDEKEQNWKEEKNDLDQDNEIFAKHNNFMSEWNTTTKQIIGILHCSEDEKHDILSGETLYNEYIKSVALINVQTQRLEKVSTNNHILELLKKQQTLTNIQNSLNKAINIDQHSLGDISKQYDTVQNKRKGSQQKLTKLFTECNDLIQNENNLFISMKRKELILKKKQAQHSKYKASSGCCGSLINAYSDFTKTNKVNIENVKIYLKTRWKSFEQQWYLWTLSDIMAWFKYKTKGKDLVNTDWMQIEKELSRQNFKCSALDSVEQNDLYMFGFTNYEIRKYLSQQIRVLVTKYPANNGNENMADYVNNDSGTGMPLKYLCPITKSIMDDPVVAFDCMTYERSAIAEYLKEHNKSPTTGVVALCDALFPNMKLKEEIELYKMTNMKKNELQYQYEGDGTEQLIIK